MAQEQTLEADAEPFVESLVPPEPPMSAPEETQTSTVAPVGSSLTVETPSGLLADVASGEVRGRAAPPPDNFSLIPWLAQNFTGAVPQDPPVTNDAETAARPESGSDGLPDEPDLDEHRPRDHQAPLETELSAAPEMPQALTDLVSSAGASSSFLHDGDPHDDLVHKPIDTAVEGALETLHPDLDMDAEAAKAAFWGDAYQQKKDQDEAEGGKGDEAAASVDPLAEDATAAGLLELAEDESRPRLLQKRRLDRAMVRKLVMLVVFATVTAAVGVTAWILRDQPSDFEQNAGLQRSDLSSKINDR